MINTRKLKFTKSRYYSAHLDLLRTADNFLHLSEHESQFCRNGNYISMVMSALAIESLCNTVLDLVAKDCGDYESASPRAKVRIICDQLTISYDRSVEPFQSLHFAISFRNRIAHAKPEALVEEGVATGAEYEQIKEEWGPQSKIEALCTFENAKRILDGVHTFKNMIIGKVSEEDYFKLVSDGFEMSSDPDNME